MSVSENVGKNQGCFYVILCFYISELSPISDLNWHVVADKFSYFCVYFFVESPTLNADSLLLFL